MKNVAIAKKVICDSILSNPSLAIMLSFFCTTRSTAIPINISGAISKSLFIIE